MSFWMYIKAVIICEYRINYVRLYWSGFSNKHVKISQLVNKMCSQQACSKLVNKLQQCCYVELQDDNKLLDQLVTSLLSSTTL